MAAVMPQNFSPQCAISQKTGISVCNLFSFKLYCLKLNGAHRLLAYADDVNIMGGSIHKLKENAEAIVAATREIGLEVSADKTKYMVMSRDQNAGRNQSVKTTM